MAKVFNEKVVAPGGIELPALASQSSLATDSSGNIVAGTGRASGVPLVTTGTYAVWTVPVNTQQRASLDIDNVGEMILDGELVFS